VKVIFLDIDGVLNSHFWSISHQKEISDGTLIDEEKVKLLAKLVKETGAVIVMHSGWRFWFDKDLKPIRKESQRLHHIFRANQLEIYAMTPDLTTNEIKEQKLFSKVKALEIIEWLKYNPKVQKWVVIDDLDLHNAVVEKRQIYTNPDVGLTKNDIDKAYKMLQNIHLLNRTSHYNNY
jgi:hydroxymethylpyrimidine pyrophosphatase-like HAD family hydrolase